MSRYARDPVSGSILPIAGGGGSGGHTILNESGTEMPQRSKLQFEGAIVSDDSVNDVTVVETVNPVDYEEDIYGVNLLDPSWLGNYSGCTVTPVYSNGKLVKYTLSGTTTSSNAINFAKRQTFDLSLPVGETFIFSLGTALPFGFLVVGYTHPTTGAWTLFKSQTTDNLEFTVPAEAEGMAWNIQYTPGNNQTFNNFDIYPMLRKATIQDDTYRPYNQQSIQNQLTEQTNVLGAKNLLKITSNTRTVNGITYTFNRDSKGNVTSIVPSGTASANSYLSLWSRTEDEPLKGLEKGKEYILSGDYGLGAGNGYVYVNFYTGATRIGGVNTDGKGETKFIIPNEADALDFGVGILNGKTAPTGFAFYPMVTPASVHDRTYVPYAMTNRELTEVKVSEITSIISNDNYSKGSLKCWYKKIGKLVELFIQIKCIATTNTWTTILDYNTIPKPALVGNYPIYCDIPAAGGTTQYPVVATFGSSNLQVRKGTPEYYYHLHTTYISE